MNPPQVRFDDGAAYEAYMGTWSRAVGDVFLQWLAPPAGWRWVDVGCGNGAFTQLLVERCSPAGVQGVDPSAAQIAYARRRPATAAADYRVGDAMALPCADRSVDAAVMALVIFFVPDPQQGVAEMVRAVRPGGSVSAYAWDMIGGGFPFTAVQQEMTALGAPATALPSIDASRIDVLHGLWSGAGLVAVETRQIVAQRTFDDFEAFWDIARTGPRIAPALAAMPGADVAALKERLRARMTADADGRITCSARANAIKGSVPA